MIHWYVAVLIWVLGCVGAFFVGRLRARVERVEVPFIVHDWLPPVKDAPTDVTGEKQ